MNGLPYYKAYPRDFIEGTIGMSFELKGAYRLILDVIYMQAGKLPDDARYISGLLGCSVRAWSKFRNKLLELGKIYAENGFISNFRADKELETTAKLQDKQRENRARPNKIKDLESPPSNHTDTDTDKRKNNKKEKLPDPLFAEFWSAYPRKVAKARAEKAWSALVKKHDPQEIIEGAKRYAQIRKGKDAEYTAHPASWLNDKRWKDDLSQQKVIQFNSGSQNLDSARNRWRKIANQGATS